MSSLSAAEIEHLATLARLRLSDEEKSRFSTELPKIVEFVEELQQVGDLREASQEAVELTSLRADEVWQRGLSLEQLEKLAPVWRDNKVEVPAVFQDE